MSDDPRLADVDESIGNARDAAEDAGIIEDPDEPKYYESGTEGEELDDQTIAPPG